MPTKLPEEALTEEEWDAIIQAAMDGDHKARELLSRIIMGGPETLQVIPSLD